MIWPKTLKVSRVDNQDYTHRIGRTGRAGSKGCAISFITNSDSEVFYDLKQMLQKSNMNIPRELMQHEAANTKPGTIAPKRKFED